MDVGRLLAERYEIVRPLAEGAMSTVWVALDKTNNVEVAIKTISLEAAGWRAEVRDRFMKEARLLARGKHEHLVGVRDVGETEDGFLYLVLDLLEGETLAERLARETRLTWREAVHLTLGISRGVAALHRTGIVHRDLKPANIVLHQTDAGVVPTIIDLGIGKASSVVGDPELCATLTATGQVLGTPQYMSYEQALGQTDIDARADVWALGVMLYEMLTGSRPFDAPNTNAVLAAIRRKEVRNICDVAPEVPAYVSDIVEICLHTNRSERFPDAETLSRRLEEASTAPPNKPVARPARVEPPRKRSFVMAIISAVALCALISIFLLRNQTVAPPPNPEVMVDVKGSATASASAFELASPITSAGAKPASSPALPASTITSSAPKATSSTRTRAPLSNVNEAGF